MSDVPLSTLHLQQCVQRWQGGDRAAAGDHDYRRPDPADGEPR
jgi:hypothetical protein